jgi:cytochrome c biogenesis protein CcdA
MTDQAITALVASAAGVSVYAQAAAVHLPLPTSAFIAGIGMVATALVTWGVFKKTTERHEEEIELLRTHLQNILGTLADVRERVARIEGKLENS